MRLTTAFEMILGAANGICVEFSVVAFIDVCCRCGFQCGDWRCTDVVSGIRSIVPRMLFLVRHMCVQGLVHSVILFVWFVDVVTGGAVATF